MNDKLKVVEEQADTVVYDIKDGIAWVRYNRPKKRNAQSPKLNRRMMEVLMELEFNDEVGALVLTGEGEAFCAGMDLKEYFRESAADGLGGTRKSQREAYGWWERLRWYQKPTIAMVNGWCFGGAYGPLFACDLAFASDDAQFGLSEINWGILPGGGASKVAVDLMSLRNAMYHAMMGENLSGKEAVEQGLVNESHPADELKARVEEVAQKLLRKNPVALKATKDAIRRVKEMTYDIAEDYLMTCQAAADSFDKGKGKLEGMKQFLDDKTYKPGLGEFDTSKIKQD